MAIEFVYFDFAGRGEPVRIALDNAGVEWKDTRISFPDFKVAKEAGKYPSGLPSMTLPSGQEVTQSVAMARYAAKMGGDKKLYPDDLVEALKVDVAMDTCQDALTKCPQDPDEATKKTKREEYAAGKLKGLCSDLNQQLEASGGPFFCGAKCTIADIVAAYFLIDMIKSGNFDYVAKDYLDTWPKLAALDTAVYESDVVKAYKAKYK